MVAWFITMFENLTKSMSHIVCLIWKFSKGGWRTAFLPSNTKWCTKCYRLCSSIINAQFKVFWIPILQSNNSPRAPWKRCAIIKPKSKRGSNRTVIIAIIENSINRYTTIKKVVFVYVVNYMSSCPQYLQTDRTEVHGAIIVLSGFSGNRFSPVQAAEMQGCSCYRLKLYSS